MITTLNLANQRGIEIVSTNGLHSVTKNFVTGSGTTTNNLQSLVYSSMNSGIRSPSVNCNVLQDFGQGFEFNSGNTAAFWEGNTMDNLGRGLVLSGGGGGIGQQGDNTVAANNLWLNSPWTGNNFGTYIEVNSTATSSPLYIKTGGDAEPANNTGTVQPQQFFGAAGTLLTASGGDYDCNGNSNYKTISLPEVELYEDLPSELYYIACMNTYNHLSLHDSLMTSSGDYIDFYSSFDGSSLDFFRQAETSIYVNDLEGGESSINSVTPANAVETNYVNYLGLYIDFAAGNFEPSAGSEQALIDLCTLCPERNGACVYQARALHNKVFNSATIFPDNCADVSTRRGRPVVDASNEKIWNVKLFPNPANDRITFLSSVESEILEIEIMDLTGRLLLKQNLKTNNFFVNLDLSLIDGAYIVNIRNDIGKRIIKKLIVTKLK